MLYNRCLLVFVHVRDVHTPARVYLAADAGSLAVTHSNTAFLYSVFMSSKADVGEWTSKSSGTVFQYNLSLNS